MQILPSFFEVKCNHWSDLIIMGVSYFPVGNPPNKVSDTSSEGSYTIRALRARTLYEHWGLVHYTSSEGSYTIRALRARTLYELWGLTSAVSTAAGGQWLKLSRYHNDSAFLILNLPSLYRQAIDTHYTSVKRRSIVN